MEPKLSIILHDRPDYWKAVTLREIVLRKPLGLRYTEEQLASEADCIHFAAFQGSEIVGTLQLLNIEEKLMKMRQVAVAPSHQGQGIGRLLVETSEAFARQSGVDEIQLHARMNAKPFYLSLAYEEVGEEFLEVGIPHIKMRKQLNTY